QRFLTHRHQSADGGGGGVEHIDSVLVDHLPATGGARVGRHSLEQQGGGATAHRPVDDIGVAGDPADVGCAPEYLAVLVVEHVMMGQCRADQVAAGGVQHALGLAGGTRGIEDEQGVFAVHRFGGAVCAD